MMRDLMKRISQEWRELFDRGEETRLEADLVVRESKGALNSARRKRLMMELEIRKHG